MTNILDARLGLARTRVTGRAVTSVTRFDEDVVTLAAEASLDIADRHAPSALVFATTTSPFAEGGTAATLAEMLGIDGIVQELGGSVAAGGAALIAGMSLVAAGIEPVLVVAADDRTDPSGRSLGAGAAAMVLGSSGDGGSLTHLGSMASWFPDVWRDSDQARLEYGDRSFAKFAPTARFADEHGAEHTVGPLGPAIPRAGVLGCAALMATMLLEAPRKGSSRRFAVGAGGLGHAFELVGGATTTRLRRLAEAEVAGGVDGPLPSPVDLDDLHPYASEPRAWRERRADLRLEAVRDPATGETFFPPIPRTPGRRLDTVRLARTGTVVTFTRDHVYPLGGPMSMTVVDLDGGGRFFGQTAGDLALEIGMKVRLVPRLLHRGGGLPHYFWKVVPDADLR